jgi:hypothetical protein
MNDTAEKQTCKTGSKYTNTFCMCPQTNVELEKQTLEKYTTLLRQHFFWNLNRKMKKCKCIF